jgi:hypothetical protein
MKTKKLLFYLLAGILGGCIPVMSLHPLFTEKDLAFDEKLLGTWVEDPNTTWEFSRTEEPKNAYKLIYTHQEKEDAKKKAKGSFIVRLVKLKDNLFLDACPALWEPEDPNMIEWAYNTLFLIPGHTFIKVNSIEPQLKMLQTDDEKMREFLKADPNAVKHTLLEDKPVLTASTKELQAFVLKYADDDRVFSNEVVLTRKKTKEPQESVKQKSNEPNDPNKG